jgi:hypothetical protein
MRELQQKAQNAIRPYKAYYPTCLGMMMDEFQAIVSVWLKAIGAGWRAIHRSWPARAGWLDGRGGVRARGRPLGMTIH